MKWSCHVNPWPLPVILIIFLHSCSFGLLEGYHKTAVTAIEPVSWFKTDSDHVLMNTTIDVIKNHFSGLMVIKSQPGNGYRVVFLTEIGLKIFDMEFIPGNPVKVHYFMEALNRKILVKTLSADMKLLLVLPEKDEEPVVYEGPSAQKMVKFKNKRGRNYYEISPLTGKPVQAYQVSGTSKKVRIDYYSKGGEEIDSVNIVHDHVNLRISMHLINENSQDAAK
jgi:hypothetical protein